MAPSSDERRAHARAHLSRFARPHISVVTRFGVEVAGVTVCPFDNYFEALERSTHMLFTFEDGHSALIARADISSMIVSDGDAIGKKSPSRDDLLHLVEIAVKGTTEDGGAPICIDTDLELSFEEDEFVVRDVLAGSMSCLACRTVEDACAEVLACLAKPARNEEG